MRQENVEQLKSGKGYFELVGFDNHFFSCSGEWKEQC
jgi:hypothetical protein